MTTMGVSIAVPEPFGAVLREMRANFGDPAAATVPSHVTLAPPFEVAAHDRTLLTQSLLQVSAAHKPFTMQLQGTGTFRPVSPVVYIAIADGIDNVCRIAEAVQTMVCKSELQFPFHPHVTVAHHLDDDGLDAALDHLANFEAEFEVDNFVLYQHKESIGWVPTTHFPLG